MHFTLYIYECFACMQVCAPCVSGAAVVKKRVLKLELQRVVSCYKDAGTDPMSSVRITSALNC